ncbi:MAG: 4Fe-4S single cluster domain-containing protein [Candidatus Nanoarchaeia archaeon]|jgi:anaerobic ribonucleoside-triphosphate reductase activating protein|nr:4Fe-4S single cluster domain-containing protein [Candidatus Nanoarchaeia archaeon]
MKLRTNYILEHSRVQGPGDRYTIWVQGCSIRCQDCNNKDTWDFNSGKFFEVDFLTDNIIKSNVDGVTLTGGEPLDQFESVLKLAKNIFQYKNIFLCSGYYFPIIQTKFKEILNFVDIVCSGPFNSSCICTNAQWKGSDNQQIDYLTKRGELVKTIPINKREYRINKHTGETIITGFSM